MKSKIFILLSGLMGFSGVSLAALEAHAAPGAPLASASAQLLVHAVAVLAGAVLIDSRRLWETPLVIALLSWVIGAALFSAAIALPVFTGHRLFPMAAPLGGTLLIAGWVALAIAAAGALYRGGGSDGA